MASSVPIDAPSEQSVPPLTPKEDADQRQNWFHSCFEWMRGCCSSRCSGIGSLPSILRGFLERSSGLLSRNIGSQGNNGIVLLPENIPSYPAYMDDPSQNEAVNTERPPQLDVDSLGDLETECDSVPIVNCFLQMSDNSKFSIE
ncbi:hypothetical protein AVEN_195625-1 [Araneus ventricosus]|uniref:Uncharacterized protein n=1 Tax=Araneus ventricosus TaxID=182803 RepID=A0A4Y2B9C0_ARAVE|nr:hypothetical protein AVEN_195625-1 [Araneus ventricosus]